MAKRKIQTARQRVATSVTTIYVDKPFTDKVTLVTIGDEMRMVRMKLKGKK